MDVATSMQSDRIVEAARASGFARSEVVRFSWSQDFTQTISPYAHMVDLCLTPRPQGASGRFADYWPRTRYERFGSLFLLPAGLTIEARAGAGEQQSVLTLFEPAALAEWLEIEQDWSDNRLSAALDINLLPVRQTMLRLAHELEFPGFASEIMIDLMNMQLAVDLSRFLRSVPERATGGLSPWRLRLIDERISESGTAPTLQELAGLVGLSVRQLTRGFRSSRGLSIGAHIEQRRIAAACVHLETGMSIKQIAYLMGFATPSGFSSAFRAAMGETPRAYRARKSSSGKRILS